MSSTAPVASAAGQPAPAPRATAAPSLLFAVLKPLASLQLTVALFALSMVLVFFGTVAMMTKGLWVVVDEYFRSFVVWIPVDLVRKFGTVFLTDVGNFPKDGAPWPGRVPFPAGWTIGFVMLVNLLAAHLVRFKLSWRRSGIILLHAGVILLMAGELVTGLFAVESTMTIQKGESSDYLDVTREFEIAVTDTSAPDRDTVTVIPHTRLTTPGKVVSHPDLPFDLRVDEYWTNTDKEDLLAEDMARPGVANAPNVLAIRSVAPMIRGVKLTPRPEAAGVDGDARSDIPSVRVTAVEKGSGKELGTFLLSLWAYQNFEQNRRIYQFPDVTVTADGKPYTLLLRNKREYQPYSVELLQFEHGKYPGTDIPKDFASTVRVRDPAGDAREARIWMNNPLRYADVSMYQHAVVYQDTGTVLQVVANPARLWPYLACTMITLGMLVHFGISLSRFLGKPTAAAAAATPGRQARWVAWAVNGLIALTLLGWVGSNLRKPKPAADGVDTYAFGELPVRDGGRVMPLDTLARSSLQAISELTEVKRLADTEAKTTVSAVRWLIDVLDTPSGDWRAGPGAKHQVFLISHHQVLAVLELPARPGFRRYSLDEIRPRFDKLMAEFEKVQRKRDEGKPLDLYDAQVEDLGTKLKMYQRLAKGRDLQLVPPAAGGDWTTLGAVDKRVLDTLPEQDRQPLLDKMDRVEGQIKKRFWEAKEAELAELVRRYGSPDKLPEAEKEKLRADVDRLREMIGAEQQAIIQEFVRTKRATVSPAAGLFTEALDAARDGKAERFQAAIDQYRSGHLGGLPPADRRKVEVEAYWLGHASPFYYAEVLYAAAAGVALFGWLLWRPLNHAALALMLATFALHTFALGLRIWISGRPPVTNLYASAVFIGWGCVLISLVLEAVYRNGVANVVGGVIGFVTCKVAYFLGGSGDTMKMLQAVLDTNFWLTVHVLTVTAGYMATFMAGGLATLYLLVRFGAFALGQAGGPKADLAKFGYLPKMTYAVLCFALLLSFFGTVSGGIWADESWGRFWGWDPKENGAVLIVVWNALILHARWCGLVKDRGVATLAIVGNMVTAWSWFGTNQLQIGLHSYGFDNRLASGCFWFWVSQLGVMTLALVPTPAKPLAATPPPRAHRAA